MTSTAAGTDIDWCVQYMKRPMTGSAGRNANGAGATTKPMFGILGDYDIATKPTSPLIDDFGVGTRAKPDWVLTVIKDTR